MPKLRNQVPGDVAVIEDHDREARRNHTKLIDEQINFPPSVHTDPEFKQEHQRVQHQQRVVHVWSADSGRVVLQRDHSGAVRLQFGREAASPFIPRGNSSDLTKPRRNLHDSRSMPINGVIIVDKPAGWTSHDVVAKARHILGERSIGHLGTLDPMATGVLPLVLGRMTRLSQFYLGAEKAYEGAIRLGVATDTYDCDGEPQVFHVEHR